MDRQAIAEGLRKIISEDLDVATPDRLEQEDRLNDDLNLDSIMVLQLAVYIEEVFEVSIPEEEVDPAVFDTVGSLTGFILHLQGVGAGER